MVTLSECSVKDQEVLYYQESGFIMVSQLVSIVVNIV